MEKAAQLPLCLDPINQRIAAGYYGNSPVPDRELQMAQWRRQSEAATTRRVRRRRAKGDRLSGWRAVCQGAFRERMEALLEVMAADGVAGMSLNAICKKYKVSVKTVKRYADLKEEILAIRGGVDDGDG